MYIRNTGLSVWMSQMEETGKNAEPKAETAQPVMQKATAENAVTPERDTTGGGNETHRLSGGRQF